MHYPAHYSRLAIAVSTALASMVFSAQAANTLDFQFTASIAGFNTRHGQHDLEKSHRNA